MFRGGCTKSAGRVIGDGDGQRLEGIRRVTRESEELLKGDREVVGGCSGEDARKVTEGLLYRASGENWESDLRSGGR